MLRRSKIAGFAILLGLGSSAAHADLFEIPNLTPGANGSSAGTLGNEAASGDVSFSLTTVGQFDGSRSQDLRFQGVATPAFVGTTSDGSLLLSDLGTFTLWRPTQGADPYQQVTFALDVAFLAPGGVVGDSTFAAVLSGTANTQHGEILINFGPAHHFTFSNAAGSGAFDLAINDVSLLLPGRHPNIESVSQALTGTITNAFDPPAQVPEPLSIVLLGSSLLVLLLHPAPLSQSTSKLNRRPTLLKGFGDDD